MEDAMELNTSEFVVVKREPQEDENDSGIEGTHLNDVPSEEVPTEPAIRLKSSSDGSTVISELESVPPQKQVASMGSTACREPLPAESLEETAFPGKSSCMSDNMGGGIPSTDGQDYSKSSMDENKVLGTLNQPGETDDMNTLVYQEQGGRDEQYSVYLNDIREENSSEEIDDCIAIKMEDDAGVESTSDSTNVTLQSSCTSVTSDILTENCHEVPWKPISVSQVHQCSLTEKKTLDNTENSETMNRYEDSEGGVEDAKLDTQAEVNQLQCRECGKEFLSTKKFQFHMRRNIKKVNINCRDCNENVVFRNKCQISSHLRMHLEEKGTLTVAISSQASAKTPLTQRGYDCKACGVNFSSASRFERHVRKPMRKNIVISYWLCTLCDQKIRVESRCKVYQHIMTHKRPMEVMKQPLIRNPEQSVSPVGKRKNVQSLPLSKACRSERVTCGGHPGNGPQAGETGCWMINNKTYQCLVCSRPFNNHPELENHLVGTDNDCHPDLCCKQCGLILPSNCSLTAHSKIHSNSAILQEPCMCPECGKCFKTSWTSFAHHVLDECLHGNRVCVLRCPVCDKIVNQTTELTVHMESHIVEIWYCKLCRSSFTIKSLLNKHLKAYHGKRKSNITAYSLTTCHQCCELLVTEALEKEHIAQHVNEAISNASFAFMCYDCDQETMLETKERLYSHSTRKHNNNNFCFMCKKKFATKTCLENHVDKVHLEDSEVASTQQDGESTAAGDGADSNAECVISMDENCDDAAMVEIDIADEAVAEDSEGEAATEGKEDDGKMVSSDSTPMEQPKLHSSLDSEDNIDAPSVDNEEGKNVTSSTLPRVVVLNQSNFKKLVDHVSGSFPEVLSREKSVPLVTTGSIAKHAKKISLLHPPDISAFESDAKRKFLPKLIPSNNPIEQLFQKNHSEVGKENGQIARMISSNVVSTSAQSKAATIFKLVATTPQTGPSGIESFLPRKPIPILPKTLAPISTNRTIRENEPLRKCSCIQCKTEFRSVNELRLHMSAQEPGTRSTPLHRCSKCYMILPNKCARKLHENLHASIQKIPAACPECGLVFVNDKNTFERHINKECFHQSRLCCIKCGHCDQHFLRSTFLDHINSRHAQLWNLTKDKCMFCRKKHYFLSVPAMTSHYQYHMKRLTMKDVTFQFFCRICKEDREQTNFFDDSEALWKHMIDAHQVLRTYSCTHCPLKFPLAESYNSHLAANHPPSDVLHSDVKEKAKDSCTENQDSLMEVDLMETVPFAADTEFAGIETHCENIPAEKVITIGPIIDHESMFVVEDERTFNFVPSDKKFLKNENITEEIKNNNRQLTSSVVKVCLKRVYDGTHFFCSVCDQKFVSPNKLLTHIQTFTEVSQKCKGNNQIHCMKYLTENTAKENVCEEQSNADRCHKDKNPVQNAKGLHHIPFCPPLLKASEKVEAHSCQFCGFACQSRSHMLFHVSECHSGFLPILFCPFCEERNIETAFGTLISLRRHLSAKHMENEEETLEKSKNDNNSTSNNTDNSCVISITMPTRDARHPNYASSQESRHVKCRVCLNVFARQGLLRKHLKQMHGIYTCVLCNNEFVLKADFEAHEHRLEETTEDFSPSTRNSSVEGKRGRKRGCEKSKNGTTEYSLGETMCRICKKTFSKPILMKKHETSEHDVHSCRFCELWFDTKEDLTKHMSETHGDQVSQMQCQVCKPKGILHVYTCKSFLDRHMREKHQHLSDDVETEDGNAESLLPSPADGFLSSSTDGKDRKKDEAQPSSSIAVIKTPSPPPVKRLRVEGDTTYTCAKCSLVTDDAVEFAEHIKEHNKDQANQCPDCGLCFTILPALKKHLFMVHKIRDSDKYLMDRGMKTEEEEVDFDAMMQPFLMMKT